MSTSLARLKKEVKISKKEKENIAKIGIEYGPRNPEDLYKWVAYIGFMDKNSPYYG